MRLLLEHGADINAVNKTGRSPLMFAVEYMHIQTVKFIANHEDAELNDVDADGRTIRDFLG